MDASTVKLFSALKNLYDVVAMQQQQLDLVGSAALGITREELASCDGLVKAQAEIDELQRIFNQPTEERKTDESQQN
jgi:hypothetical protein